MINVIRGQSIHSARLSETSFAFEVTSYSFLWNGMEHSAFVVDWKPLKESLADTQQTDITA